MHEVINHLWQTTAFILLVAVAVKALRRNSPRARYWLWFAASVKFLIPFSLLISTGARIQIPSKTRLPHADMVVQISTYFDPVSETTFAPTSESSASVPGRAAFPWMLTLTAVWLLGVFLLLVRWFRRWRKMHRAVGQATRLPIQSSVPILSSPVLMEPGVFGFLRPVILLPRGIAERLTAKQFEYVLAHELRHIKCFDNLTAAFHMGIETLFWFHPLVWWIGAKLMDERERDCDEAVLKQGSQPADYARGIVQVCETYIATELPCASGISGSDLKKRVQEIMTWRGSRPVAFSGKAILVSAAIAAVSVPLAIGVLRAQAEPVRPAAATQAEFGTVTGTVVDPTGAVVPGVNVSLASVAGRVVDGTFMPIEILQVRTNNAGAFAFPRVATGDWTFRTGVAGFTNIVRAVQMRSGQAVVQNVSLTVANLATTLNVTANRPGQSQNAIRRGPPLRIGGEIIQPRLISQVQPAYPEAARDSGVQDFVQLQAVIGKDGTIDSVQVDPKRSSPGNPDLDKAAMAAVQQWRYSPAVLNGVPIEVTTTIRVNFTLD